MNGSSRRSCQKLRRLAGASQVAPQPRNEATALIEELLEQGPAQFSIRGDTESDSNPKERSDSCGSIIRSFEASMADIETAAATTVRSRLGTYLRNELRRVLEDATKSCDDLFGDSELTVQKAEIHRQSIWDFAALRGLKMAQREIGGRRPSLRQSHSGPRLHSPQTHHNNPRIPG